MNVSKQNRVLASFLLVLGSFSLCQGTLISEKDVLLLAAKRGDVEAARGLITRKTNPVRIDITDEQKNTIFHLALYNKQTDFIKRLKKHMFILMNKQNDEGETPFHVAVSMSNDEIVALLLQRVGLLGIRFVKDPGSEHWAMVNNVKKMIKAQDDEGNTVLHYMVKLGKKQNAKRFIELIGDQTAVLNMKNNKNQMATDIAKNRGYDDLVLILLGKRQILPIEKYGLKDQERWVGESPEKAVDPLKKLIKQTRVIKDW